MNPKAGKVEALFGLFLIVIILTAVLSPPGVSAFQSPVSPLPKPATPTPVVGDECPYILSWRTCTLVTEDDFLTEGTCSWSLPFIEEVDNPEDYLCGDPLPDGAMCEQYWTTDNRKRHQVTCTWPINQEPVKSSELEPVPIQPELKPSGKPTYVEHVWTDCDDLWMGKYRMMTSEQGGTCIPDLADCG